MPRDASAVRPSAIGLVPVLGAILFATAVARFPIVTADLWWHLATGRLVATSGIPRTDPFSWTMAGQPWLVHEWLADRVLHASEVVGGLIGVVTLRAALLTLAAVVAYRLARRHSNLLIALPLVALAAWTSQRNWLDRPQLWSYALAPFVLLLLEQARSLPADKSRQRAVTWGILPVIFAAWVNLHGAFMFGLALVAAWTLGRALETRRVAVARSGALLLALCAVATLFNPNGLRGVLYPLRYVGSGLAATIQEERPGALDGPQAWTAFALLLALVVSSIAASTRRPRSLPLPHLLVAVLLAWLAMPRLGGWTLPLAAERHAPLLLFAGVPLLAWRIAALSGIEVQRLEKRLAGVLCTAPAWVAMVAMTGFVLWAAGRDWPRDGSPKARLFPGRFPVAGAGWLASRALPPHLLNPYRWGGYLAYMLSPRYAVSIDSRGDFYGADRLAQDELLYRMPPGSISAVGNLLEHTDPDVVIWYLLTLDFGALRVHPLARFLLDRPQEWRLVYVDGADRSDPRAPWATTAIFLRVQPRNATALATYPAVQPPSGLPH